MRPEPNTRLDPYRRSHPPASRQKETAMDTATSTTDPTGLLLSEKLDGVQGRWDSTTLRTREGHTVHAPAAWLATLPPTPCCGEIWLGRGRFDQVSGLVGSALVHAPADPATWRDVQFRPFPGQGIPGDIAEEPCTGPAHLAARLADVLALGGEGLVLRQPGTAALAGLKVKPIADADATVTGYAPGAGRYTGQVGALIVRLSDGRTTKLGAGLTDADRRCPPPIGATVKYAFNGLTGTGLPRFARYLSTRADAPATAA
jgi:DNA ligase-1